MTKTAIKTNDIKINKRSLRKMILDMGGVTPRGHGDDYQEYLDIIKKYKSKVQPPLNIKPTLKRKQLNKRNIKN
jgi:hypothetical protein